MKVKTQTRAQAAQVGRRFAYVTMFGMLALSLAGNVAHVVQLDPSPSVLSVIRAMVWPIGVWLGVELFVRVPWEAIITHRLVRWVGLLLVAFIAALVSYRHLRGLMIADNEEAIVYNLGPIAIDGLMLMATLALLLTRPKLIDDETPPSDYHGNEALMARIAELEQEVRASALPDLTQPVPASQEVREFSRTTGNGKSELTQFTLADVLPQPVSAPPAIPGLQLGEPQPLPGWSNPNAPVVRPRRTRKTWDEGKAREMIHQGASKAEVSAAVGVDEKTIQRLRKRMTDAGEL